MHTDAWFAIGDTHVVCEDFALAGRSPAGQGFAIVCDGCSSSPQTDVGARLLATAARTRLMRDELPEGEVIERAAQASALLQLPPRALDATLLVALTDEYRCRVRVFGDGVIAAWRRDGTLQVHRFEHPEGAPPYLSYRLDPDRQAQWARVCSPVLVEHRLGLEPCTIEHAQPPLLCFAREQFTGVLLGSDGLDAFVHVDEGIAHPVPSDEVLGRLARVAHPRGRFLARRGRRFLRRECPRAGWHPTDDVSVAAILWNQEAA